jgi:radical SAM superfamily enzyme YgiQ (UPF0313 family)
MDAIGNGKRRMKITFIKPNMGLVNGRPYSDRGKMMPLTFAVLAGLTPPEHEVLLFDDRYEAIPFDEPTDLVGINTEVYTAKRAYEIADQFRMRGVKVVLGGCHTTMIPDESMEHADAVVLGDAETVWTKVLDDVSRGEVQPLYRGATSGNGRIMGLRTDWRIFKGKKYLPVTLTQMGRGCNKACDYCATASIFKKTLRCRPVDDVVNEIRNNGSRNVFFVDENIIADPDAAKELFRAIRPLRIRWVGQSTLEFVRDGELTDLLVESGCAGLVIGFESLDPVNLARMNKTWNLEWEGQGCLESYDPLVERMKRAGLQIWAAFALGYDNETPDTIRETCDWALSHKFSFAAFNILTPYPGTPLYKRMKDEGRLLYEKWWMHDHYRFGHAVFRPKNMEPEELSQACLEARLRFNSKYQILRRATERNTNSKDLWSLITYFAYNPLLRDEIVKKHGMILGYGGLERKGSHVGFSGMNAARSVAGGRR